MTDWRTMMQEPFPPTQYPQNPQKWSRRSNSEDIEDIAHTETQPESVIEFASPTAKPIYWERGDTSISGPATPLFLEQVGTDSVLVIEYQGDLISINANTLRSKSQFETQVKLQVVELVREPK